MRLNETQWDSVDLSEWGGGGGNGTNGINGELLKGFSIFSIEKVSILCH